jgi:hypothetical protein
MRSFDEVWTPQQEFANNKEIGPSDILWKLTSVVLGLQASAKEAFAK